jgi:hypothetical protein
MNIDKNQCPLGRIDSNEGTKVAMLPSSAGHAANPKSLEFNGLSQVAKPAA